MSGTRRTATSVVSSGLLDSNGTRRKLEAVLFNRKRISFAKLLSTLPTLNIRLLGSNCGKLLI